MVEDEPDRVIWRVRRVEFLQQGNELHTAMARMHLGRDMSRVEVQSSQQGEGSKTFVLVIPRPVGMPARFGRQVGMSTTLPK